MAPVTPIRDVQEAIRLFTEVARTDPLSVLLVAAGGALTAVTIAVFTGLSAGGAVSALARLRERLDRRD